MAMVVLNNPTYEEKSRRSSFKSEKKPWMLRDYLKDDMSLCSSSGFRSFPRKQCCVAAVKNIVEKNQVIRTSRSKKIAHHQQKKTLLVRNNSVSSALQRASTALINIVKLLPFNTFSANTGGGGGRRFLPRSFSKKLVGRNCFWKKSEIPEKRSNNNNNKSKNNINYKNNVDDYCEEIERWISSGVVAAAKYVPLDLSNDTSVTNNSMTSNSNSNSNDGKGSSDGWSDITFTSDYLNNLSDNESGKKSEKMQAEDSGGDEDEDEVVSKRIGVFDGEVSAEEPPVTVNTWCKNEESETKQLSPNFVMDFPYNDEGSASPLTLRVSRLRGTKDRLMEKLGRFESLAAGIGLEPINLETLMSSTKMDDNSPKDSIQSCSTPSFSLSSDSESSEESEESEEEESQEDVEENRVQNILYIIKLKSSNYKVESDNLLLNFLRENVREKADGALLKLAEDWINGHYDTMILGWEVKDKRMVCIRDMEERGGWPKDCKVEKEEVANELGNEVLESLIQEVILEF